MDHKDQHHQHHEKEREQKKKEQHQHELAEEKSGWPMHPAWFMAIGVVLIVIVILIWSFI